MYYRITRKNSVRPTVAKFGVMSHQRQTMWMDGVLQPKLFTPARSRQQLFVQVLQN